MYFPILRGKQYELLLLRENAGLLNDHRVFPVIEPVNGQVSALKRAIKELRGADAHFCVLLNPTVGDFKDDSQALAEIVLEECSDYDGFSAGLVVHANSKEKDLAVLGDEPNTLIFHMGQIGKGAVFDYAKTNDVVRYQVFAEEQCGKLYRKNFAEAPSRRVVVRDGFIQRRNADYEAHEHFSDLHATFGDEGMDGFGDYLVVGHPYQEGGGPAHAIVIHITYVDEDEDMQICHFKSRRTESAVDPGGKFAEALEELIFSLDQQRYPISETTAIEEFRSLNERGHYPGLGYLKKLAMQHHLETLNAYLAK